MQTTTWPTGLRAPTGAGSLHETPADVFNRRADRPRHIGVDETNVPILHIAGWFVTGTMCWVAVIRTAMLALDVLG